MLAHGGLLKATGMQGLGDGPLSLPDGAQCNTAGGYSLAQPTCYMTPQCMTAAQLAAANAACAAPASAGAPAGPMQPPTLVDASGNPTNNVSQAVGIIAPATTQPVVAGAVAPATDIMLGSFDATQFFQNYGIWVVGGIAVIAVIALAK